MRRWKSAPERPCGYLPGRPHRSLPDIRELSCFNVYLNPGRYDVDGVLSALRGLCRRRGYAVCWPDIEAAIARYCGNAPRPPLPRRPPDLDETVARLAQLSGMSREGFSRHFKRAYGLPPQLFRSWQGEFGKGIAAGREIPNHRRIGGGVCGSKPYGPPFPPFFWSHPRPVSDRESHIRSRNPPPIRYRPKQRYPLLRRLLWKT